MGIGITANVTSERRILVVEDDSFFRLLISEMLGDLGYQAVECSTTEEAIALASKQQFGLFLVDAMLPNAPLESGIGDAEARGGFQAGVSLLRKLRRENPETPAILITGFPNAEVQRWCLESSVVYMLKPLDRPDLRKTMENLLGKKNSRKSPSVFVVHGKDQEAFDQLQSLIRDRLGFDRSIVLRDVPGHGRTLIESLESFRHIVDVVFVLLTPDDKFCGSDTNDEVKRRARQNVIFELGLFYGYLGRLSGRVILLHKGPIDLPTDIDGIKYIDMSKGMIHVETEARRELSQWL